MVLGVVLLILADLYMHLHGRGEGANLLFLALHAPSAKTGPGPILCQNRVQ
jgi:hypothetical protein